MWPWRLVPIRPLILVCLLFMGAQVGEAALDGAGGFRQALEQSRQTGKPVAMFVYTDWCPYCRQFISKVLSSGEVRQYLAGIIEVRLNPEHGQAEEAIARRYGVTGYPTYFIFPPGSDQPRRVAAHGGMAPAQFVQECKKASGVQRPATAKTPAARRTQPAARPATVQDTALQGAGRPETTQPKKSSQPAPAGLVTLHLTDGRAVTGWLIQKTPEALTLAVINSGIAAFERASITRIEPATLEE